MKRSKFIASISLEKNSQLKLEILTEADQSSFVFCLFKLILCFLPLSKLVWLFSVIRLIHTSLPSATGAASRV